jgi:hypothetical protein
MYELIDEKTAEKKTLRVMPPNSEGITNIQEMSDIAQTIKELNDDKVSETFTAIDMKSNLSSIEISSIIAVDSLVALRFLPREVSFITRAKKRLSISQNAGGRKDIVAIAQGMRQQQQGETFFSRLGGLFRGGG